MAKIISTEALLDDPWQHFTPETSIEAGGHYLLSFEDWALHAETLQIQQIRQQNAKVGITLSNQVELDDISPLLEDLDLICLQFPAFADGRAYSQARLLRERYGYQQDLRATGDVLQDQLFLMKRCGFSSFALRDDQDVERCLAAFATFSDSYQPATDQQLPLFKRR